MLNRNIKQSLTALEILDFTYKKIFKGEFIISTICTFGSEVMIHVRSSEQHYPKYLELYIQDSNLIVNGHSDVPKKYVQELSDDEMIDVKRKFIKIAQKHQDDFEQWIKDVDDNIDNESEIE